MPKLNRLDLLGKLVPTSNGGRCYRLRSPWVLGVIAAASPGAFALGAPVTFTWDPSHATPALTSAPATFSADAVSLTNAIRTTNVNDLSTLRQNFTGTQFEVVNGFTLGGAAVSAPGLNSAYGLYFKIGLAGAFPIGADGKPIGPATYSSLNIQLVADTGHDDGSLVDDAAGIGFSNASGVSNDVVLATGELLSASLALNPGTGTRSAYYVTTFQAVASEASFFAGSSFGVNLDLTLSTPAADFQVIPVDALTVLNLGGAHGTATGTAQLVPEPAAIALLGAGILGLIMVRRLERR